MGRVVLAQRPCVLVGQELAVAQLDREREVLGRSAEERIELFAEPGGVEGRWRRWHLEHPWPHVLVERRTHWLVYRPRKELGIEKVGVLLPGVLPVPRMLREAGHRDPLPHLHRGSEATRQLLRVCGQVFFGDRSVVAPVDAHGSHQRMLRILTEGLAEEGALVRVTPMVDEPGPARERPARCAEAQLGREPFANRLQLTLLIFPRAPGIFFGAVEQTQLPLFFAEERTRRAARRRHFWPLRRTAMLCCRSVLLK